MNKHKILYVIYASHEKSGGGHYYSLMALADRITRYADVNILNIGLQHVSTLADNITSAYIKLHQKSLFGDLKEIYNYVKDLNPDVIHCYDYNSWVVMNLIRVFIPKPLVFTKCGGKNMSRFVPTADHFIFFSKENLQFHQRHSISKAPISLLPNRVGDINPDRLRISQLVQKLKLRPDQHIILRISRFSELHKLSLLQSIELLRLLIMQKGEHSVGDYVLIIIGIIQSEEVYQDVLEMIGDLPVVIITDSYFTNNASQIIDIADIVVASGRGVMEAAALNKRILCPLKDSLLPAPFNNSNFEKLFEKNFSNRVDGINVTPDKVLSFIGDRDQSNFSIEMYNKYFSLDNVLSIYNDIYNKARLRSRRASVRASFIFLLTTLYFFIKMPKKK